MPKIKSIVIDTLTAIQTNQYMEDKRKPGHDQWKDYGSEIYTFTHDLQELGFECIMVLGEPGTGKSSGMMTLESGTNIWYNADEKNPVWTGGVREYGRKNTPTTFHRIPKSYKDIIDSIKKGLSSGAMEDVRFAFVIGHTEVFKAGNDNRERLRTLGKVATKMQLEAKMETVLYSKVEMVEGKPTYVLETQNNGFNTTRSPMGVFEGKIPNDYKLIIDKISAGY